MSMNDTIVKDALALSEDRRLELVGTLLRSLPPRKTAEVLPDSVSSKHDDDTCITWEGVQGFLED
jgi:hypothetical protein